MLTKLKNIINDALIKLNYPTSINFIIKKSKKTEFGDFTSNVVLALKKNTNETINVISQKIISQLSLNSLFKTVSFVFPGFLNIKLNLFVLLEFAKKVTDLKNNFGFTNQEKKSYHIECVSANPTGLLHIGHARNGVFGDTLATLLKKFNHEVKTEYLINDAGKQIYNLAYAVYVRYMQIYFQKIELPKDSYYGFEIIDCALFFSKKYYDQYLNNFDYQLFSDFAVNYFLTEIKSDLKKYNIEIETWFSEKEMHKKNQIYEIFEHLKNSTYWKDNALWFEASKYQNDCKDEVLIKSDGSTTYYAQDLAYHYNKISRCPKKMQLIDIFGADHHGHVLRLKNFFKALNYDNNKVFFAVTQLIRLIKNNKEVKMSKRTGQSLLMRDVYDSIGYEALRWFLVSQSINSHIDINLDLIKEESASNPIYYVLYAYARIWQILSKVNNYCFNPDQFNLLTTIQERELINQIYVFENTNQEAAVNFEPHRICNYLYELAKYFHSFYNKNHILNLNNKNLQKQRLDLIYIIQQIFYNGLSVLKIVPKKQMLKL